MTGGVVITAIPSGTPAVSVSVTNPNCPGAQGTASFTFTGGTLPYSVTIGSSTYSGSSPVNVQLPAGSYNYTATDANNCTQQTGTFSIIVPDAISINGNVTNATCGQSNGAISITVSGGTLPVTAYKWTGPNSYTSTNQNITALAAGTYSVLVTDSKSCTASKSFTVGSGSSPILLNVSSANNGTVFRTSPTYSKPDPVIWITNKTGNFGLSSQVTLSATASNGAGGYTYSWSPRTGLSSTKTASVTAKPSVTTTYTLTVKDSKGCTSSTQVKVTVYNITCGTTKKPGVTMCVGGSTQCVLFTNTTVINNTNNLFGSCGTSGIPGAKQDFVEAEPSVGVPAPEIIAYPNPTDGKLNLELMDFPEGNARISLFNAGGSLSLDKNVSIAGDCENITLDISNFPQGLYLVRIIHAEGMSQTTIIKK
jgi:hypothetical protein